MSPVTHLLLGWAVAQSAPLDRRGRAVVTVAGVIPDLDGLGLIAEVFTRNSSRPLNWWSDYHHVLGHNLGFCMLATVVALAVVRQSRWKVGALSLLSFHLHLLGDLVGARGPDGHQWPIPYLLPFSDAWQLTWQRQWALNGWPNFVITALLLALTLYWAWKRGCSPLEIISLRADQTVVTTLRRRFS